MTGSQLRKLGWLVEPPTLRKSLAQTPGGGHELEEGVQA